MTVERFEDLRIWQNARIQANSVYDLLDDSPSASRDFPFRNQLVGCVISVMNNIAEGFERRTDPDFGRFLDIAKGSNGEVRSMLYLAEDRSYATPEKAATMRSFCEDISRGIEALASYLRS